MSYILGSIILTTRGVSAVGRLLIRNVNPKMITNAFHVLVYKNECQHILINTKKVS